MENKFTEKGIVRKIIIALVFLVVFNFVYPYIPSAVYAAEDTAQEESLPLGPLFEPLMSLVTGLGEGVIWIIQNQLLGMGISNVHYATGEDGTSILVGVLTGVGAGLLAFLGPAGWGIGAALAIGAGAGITAGAITSDMIPDDFYMPLYRISPQEIFSDSIPALHINFINPTEYAIENSSDNTVYNSAKILGPQIAKWYVAIRNMVLVGLMVVLLYIGIRIVISSTAGEKAKYKEHIKDWLIAVILVVFMHYIMAFAMTMTEYITSMLNSQNEVIKYEMDKEAMEEFAKATDTNISEFEEDGKYYFYTNLMGYARLEAQLGTVDERGNVQFTWSFIGYSIIYIALVIYTVMFLIIYLKRVIYMAFLTMIAPLVALTYPIDKISDGKAQAFDMWLKEYVYNLLLQPFHLLLYTLLIGSVMDLATNNMIYALVALGFLIPAEKLLRKFFGFEKAATTGSIVGGVVGGSLAMNAINKIGKIGSGKGSSSKGSGGSSDESSSNIKLQERKADKDTGTTDELFQRGFAGIGSGNAEEDDSQIHLSNKPDASYGAIANTQVSDISDDKLETVQRFKNWKDEKKEELSNSPQAIRLKEMGTDALSAGMSTYDTGKEKVNGFFEKTPIRRDMKRLAIKGAKVVKAAGGTGMKYTGKALTEVGNRAPRMIAQGALGATMATAGVAAGLASGDLENAFTYGAAAAGVGAHLGSAATSVAGNIGQHANDTARGMRQDFRERYYDKDELERKQNDEADEKWRKDEAVIKLYKEKFGEKDYKQAMDTAMTYRRQGVTDDKAIIGAQKLEGLGDGNSDKRVAMAKAATMVKSDKDMKGLKERLGDLGVSDTEVKEIGKNIRKINKM